MSPYQRALLLAFGLFLLASSFILSAFRGDQIALALWVSLYVTASWVWFRAEVIRRRRRG